MGAEVIGLDSCPTKAVDPDRVAAAKEQLLELDEAGDLAETIEIPESRLSHALRLLRTAGIVKNRRDGRMIYYSLDDGHVRLLLDLSLEHLRHDAGMGR